MKTKLQQASLDRRKYLRFDDLKFAAIGILLMGLIMPLVVEQGGGMPKTSSYWGHDVPEVLILVFIFWIFLRSVIIGVRRLMPGADRAIWRLVLELTLAIVLLPIIKSIVTYFLDSFCPFPDQHYIPEGVRIMAFIYIPTFLVLAIYEAIYFYYQYQEQVNQRQEMEKQHLKAQMDNLRSQVNPHFLFNGLNTLMALIPTDTDVAMNYLSKMSKFYRYLSATKEETLIPLDKEFEYTRLYVDLLKERFKEGLMIKLPSQAIPDAMIPPLSLQLLLENAVKHNIVSRSQPLHISILIDPKEEYLTVENNIQEKIHRHASTGVGLRNIEDRLRYYTPVSIKIEHDNDTFRVTLPIIKAKVDAKK